MVYFVPVGSILRAGRALANTSSKASKAVDKAFTDSSPKAAASPTAAAPASYVVTEEVSKWKPRLIARADGIEVDPRDVHLIASSSSSQPPSPRAAVQLDDVELHEKKTDSAADVPPPPTAASSEAYFLYYRLLNSDSSVFYTSRLRVGDNHVDVGCQLCTPDERGECPCMTSCGFDIRFDANINTITVMAPPSAAAIAQAPPAAATSKSGIKGFMANVGRAVLAERIQSQEVDIAYQKTEPRPDHPPTHQVMELNAVRPFNFYSEHHDCICLVLWLHLRGKVQKNVGMQLLAMPQSEGDALASKWTWYSCTAC